MRYNSVCFWVSYIPGGFDAILQYDLTNRVEVVQVTRLVNILIEHRLIELYTKPWFCWLRMQKVRVYV